jgi:DNA-binding NtrC family response regulator
MTSSHHEYNSILVLDDEFDIVTIIKHDLERHGFRVLSFTDPHLALRDFQLNAENYDLIISDVRMPGMNGFEFLRKVKEIRPDIKVFLMTAFEINNLEFSNVIPSIKVDEFVPKPITMEKLGIIIKKHLKVF